VLPAACWLWRDVWTWHAADVLEEVTHFPQVLKVDFPPVLYVANASTPAGFAVLPIFQPNPGNKRVQVMWRALGHWVIPTADDAVLIHRGSNNPVTPVNGRAQRISEVLLGCY